MKFRFTIGKKIGSGFGLLILLTLIVFTSTYITIQKSRETNDWINTVNTPSIKVLQELKTSILETKLYLITWFNMPKDHEDKRALIKYQNIEYPKAKKELEELAQQWTKDNQDSLQRLFKEIDLLFKSQKDDVINVLNSFESYADPLSTFSADYSMETGGNVATHYKMAMGTLNNIIVAQKNIAQTANKNMFSQFETLKFLARNLGIALIFIGVVIAWFTTKNIVTPIYRLKDMAVKLGRGVFPQEKLKVGDDEIGEMTEAINNVISGLKSTKDFATEVGSGNFNTEYHPLSSKDSLGKALLKMRDDLAENERVLEDKVRKRTAEVVKQNEKIVEQKAQIEEYYEQVTDSIKYAKRIQEAILPPEHNVKKLFPQSFILYQPKDIVSGDFYWIDKAREKAYIAAVDCTGHGVPGALMSIVGYNQLKQALITTKGGSPAEILDGLNLGVSETLHQYEKNSKSRDGMDVAICAIDFKNLEVEYAGAFNPLYLLRDNKIIQTKGNKFPIGAYFEGKSPKFTNHQIKLQEGDQLYIFSDGYPDQFGGPKGRKFMYKNFRDLLLKNNALPIHQQKEQLQLALDKWMVKEEQVDDILVIGVQV